MANNIHISYDLYKPGQNYENVIAKIKTLGGWAKIHKSFWYLDTPLSAEEVARAVWYVMDQNDSLYVVDVTNNMAHWYNISPEASQYIQQHWYSKAA
ncbi:CRISPR-associated protein Cas2 [Nitratireductor sp. GCM10026969]|uniref:CRISPR-associated protein Cas2 n=1 Tax=Nitratireductor sp. GCM10026969 TaxID=3252645 RepID=UPI0036126DAC